MAGNGESHNEAHKDKIPTAPELPCPMWHKLCSEVIKSTGCRFLIRLPVTLSGALTPKLADVCKIDVLLSIAFQQQTPKPDLNQILSQFGPPFKRGK